MLAVEDIHTYYGASHVLQGVSLTVAAGEAVAVLGRNGAGKTTLIRSVVGFTPPRRGRVVLDGRDITRVPSHRIARLGVGVVPQGRRVFPSLDVREHLLVGARPGSGAGWTIDRILDLLPRLRERLRHRGGTLSGGEQSMLACGRALVGNPRLLVLDEPSEGLAPLLVRELATILSDLKAAGTSILLVEQNLAFALGVADRVHVMNRGRIVHSAVPDELRRDETVKTRYLGIGDARR